MHYTLIDSGHSYVISSSIAWLLVTLVTWSLIWKGLALWKAGRNNQKVWFIVLLILNTAGLLDIIYLIFFRQNPSTAKDN